MVTKSEQKMTAGLTSLLLDEPFYGCLALKLELIADPTIETEATDGKSIRFNPAFIESIPFEQVKHELRHEVEHNARGHQFRRGDRDPQLWNVACDYVINNDMVAEGAKLDSSWLVDPQYKGMSEEQVYTKLEQQPKQKQEEQCKTSENHGQVSDAKDTPKECKAEQQQNWQQAVLQAAQQAKQAGKLPAFAAALVEQIKNPQIDWIAATRKFLEQTAKNDFTWTRPSRRYITQGLYLPSIRSEQLPPVVIYWDTSGSRWSDKQRQLAANEIASVISDARPEKTFVIYADSEVKKVDVFELGDPIKFDPVGGGGTRFEPVFEYIEKEQLEPCCFIGISDLDGSFPKNAPDYPVLWVTDEKGSSAPFGDVIEVTNP
jgi:predicted metal-dependent peptidase